MAKTDAMGRDIAYEYDASGNKTSRIDPKSPTEWEYDAMNRETTHRCQGQDNRQGL